MFSSSFKGSFLFWVFTDINRAAKAKKKEMGKQRKAIPNLLASLKQKAPIPASPPIPREEQYALDHAIALSRETIQPGLHENAYVGGTSGSAPPATAAVSSTLAIKETKKSSSSSKSKKGRKIPSIKELGVGGPNLSGKRTTDETSRGSQLKRPRVIDQSFYVEYLEKEVPLLNNPAGCGRVCRELRDRKSNFPELADLVEGGAYFDASQKMCAVSFFLSLFWLYIFSPRLLY